MPTRRSVTNSLLTILGMAVVRPVTAASRFTGPWMPYDAFDGLDKTVVRVGRSALEVGIAPGALALSRAHLIGWVEKSASAVSVYYGRFPVTKALILIVPVGGKGVTGGQAFAHRGPAIRLMVGQTSNDDDLLVRDWQMVHEMIHLALPRPRGPHTWLSEGVAVYAESIARVQAGHRQEGAIWREFMRDMPRGLPGPGDRGLDGTPSWGRTYWGGALFCLLADVELRKHTGNRHGLQHALRAVLDAGGTHEDVWPIGRILRTGDDATGTTVLAELYETMRARPHAPDLPKLWSEMGMTGAGRRLTFDEGAPLAAIRRAIVTRLPRAVPQPTSG